MRRIVLLIFCATISFVASSQSKLKYSITDGLRIEGVDASSPIIYDNDMVEDTPEDEYLWMRYSLGHANLVGNIITRNMDRCNLGPCKYTMQQTIDQWNRVVNSARNAGQKILMPVVGSENRMQMPASRKIEETRMESSPGVDLIIREALKASKERPLVVLVGGQATTVANAYLKNPSIADRIVVIHINGYRDAPVARGFNTIDAWSAYIVMKKMRYVNYTGDLYGWYKGKNVNLTQTMVNSLPNNHFSNALKTWYSKFFHVEVLADAPPVLWLFQPTLWKNAVRKLENGQTTTSDTFDYLLISENDWTAYGPALINYMKNPGNSQGSVNKPPVVNITSPTNNASYNEGATININANASDPDGSISKVEFYSGNTKLGEDVTSPYSFQMTNVKAGTITLTAKAFDNKNSSTASSIINVTIKAANQKPAVKITTPADNSTFTSATSITIEATASDPDGNVAKVEFYNGSTKLGEDQTQPYSFTWSNAPLGTSSLTAKAIDNNGEATTSTAIKITVSKPNTPPSVALTSPANNSSYTASETVAISANASDSDGTITKVEFFQNGTKLGEDATAPFNYEWTNIPAGKYSLTAKAFDNSGATTTSSVVTITVVAPNVPPTTKITAPANQSSHTEGSAVTIEATAADNDGSVTKVEFYNGSTKLGEDTSAPYSFEWKNIPAGKYSLTAKAFDNNGASTTSSVITITVAAPNAPPTVKITAPANQSSHNAGSTITIAASAADSDGSVTKVEFYNGSTKLGGDTSAPYSFEWKNVGAGTYSITVKATDNKGSVATSAAITVSVEKPNVSPTVKITSPANKASFENGATVSIQASASDSDGSVSKVEFFNGNSKLGEDLTAPYSFEWRSVVAGDYRITAKATDNKGAVSTSNEVNIIVAQSNKAPMVKIISPVNKSEAIEGSTITIEAAASDSDGSITKVEFYNGGTKLGEDATAPYSFTWTDVPRGVYAFTAKAFDNRSATSSSSPVEIKIIPAAVTNIVITSPLSNSVFNTEDDVTIQTEVTTDHGKITKVEFFNGSQKIGEDASSPYTFAWKNISEGKHTIIAKAHHEQGKVISSAPVVIEVKKPSIPTDGEPAPSVLVADAGKDLQLALPENSATLASGSTAVNAEIVEYHWAQMSGPHNVLLVDANASQITVTDLLEGTYIFRLTVADNFGNTASDEVRIDVLAPTFDENIVPRYFTPNDDGINDKWEFEQHELFTDAQVTILNRAGQIIFSGTTNQDPWDGKLEGKPLAPGPYFYIIRLADGRDIKGSVRIIR